MKQKGLWFIVLGLGILLAALLFVFQTSTRDVVSPVPVFSSEELQQVDASDWSTFTHPDFGYVFVVPRDAFMARTFSGFDGDVSALLQGKQKQTFAISKGESYYIYLYPEGGYVRDDLATKGKTPVLTKEDMLNGKKIVRQIYDKENVIIRFVDHHDFRMQLFVKDGIEGNWREVEKIVSLMQLDEVMADTQLDS